MKINARPFGCGVIAGLSVGLTLSVALAAVVYVIHLAGRQDDLVETAYAPGAFCPAEGDQRVTNLLLPIRQEHRVPAMAGLLLSSEGVQTVGVVGVRKLGEEAPATLDDCWHLGSDGKAMTATVLARLVEQGRVGWDTSVSEVFPDLAPTFRDDLAGVTPLHLLSHRAGLRANLSLPLYLGDEVRKLRLRALRKELARAPEYEPGSETRYSNLGYILAGAVIEQVTGRAWEEVIREELFAPLEMETAGFGGPGTPGQLDQPWGHKADGRPAPGNGPSVDNPPVMGPAGRVHCSIRDWARFVRDQLRGSLGAGELLTPESYAVLHTPPFGGDYALGWSVLQRDWGGGTVMNHCGDNTMNFANVWIAPQRDFAVLVCVNQGGDAAFQASDAAVGALLNLHLESTD